MILTWLLDPLLIGGSISMAVAYTLATTVLRNRIVSTAPYPKARVSLFYSSLVLLYLSVSEGSPLTVTSKASHLKETNSWKIS